MTDADRETLDRGRESLDKLWQYVPQDKRAAANEHLADVALALRVMERKA